MKFVNIQLLPLRKKSDNSIITARKYLERIILKDRKKYIRIYGYDKSGLVYAVGAMIGRMGKIDDCDIVITHERYFYEDGEALFTTISYSDVVAAHPYIVQELEFGKKMSDNVTLIEKNRSQIFY